MTDLDEDGTEFRLALTRPKLEELLQKKFDRCLELVRSVIKDCGAKLDKS